MPEKISTTRYPIIDVLRGCAIAMMFIYHFCFDLGYFKLVDFDFYNGAFWINFRIVIVSSFLLLVGMSLYLATARKINWHSYRRRLFQIVLYAGLVSLASHLVFPRSMIFFGILHFIALASLIGLAFVRQFWLNLVLGTALIILGIAFSHPFFNQSFAQWFGLMTHKPITEDYVPLLPWFGVVLIGIFAGRWLFSYRPAAAVIQWRSRNPVFRILRFGGQHSLHIYMLHQPVFLGAIYLWLQLFK